MMMMMMMMMMMTVTYYIWCNKSEQFASFPTQCVVLYDNWFMFVWVIRINNMNKSFLCATLYSWLGWKTKPICRGQPNCRILFGSRWLLINFALGNLWPSMQICDMWYNARHIGHSKAHQWQRLIDHLCELDNLKKLTILFFIIERYIF